MKQRELEEMDFDLKEEKKQHRESRLFLARKMSELEARELRSAKERERLSLLSTPCSSADRTPASSRRSSITPSRGTPTQLLNSPTQELEELVHAEVQTAAPHPIEEASSWRRSCRPSFLCIAVMLAKAFYVAGVVILPEMPAETLAEMAAWVPGPLRDAMLSFEIGIDLQEHNETIAQAIVNQTSSLQVDASCQEALHQTRMALASLQKGRNDPTQRHATGGETAPAASLDAAPSPHDVDNPLPTPPSTHDVEIQQPSQQNWWLSSLLATSTTVVLVAIRNYI